MKYPFFLILSIAFILIGCKKNNDPAKPEKGFVDYGYIASSSLSGPDAMFFYKGEIFVATDNGIWKIRIGEKQWHQSGLNGKKIDLIYCHPDIDGAFYAAIATQDATEKTFYVSHDAAQTWAPAESPVYDDFNGRYESYFNIIARPGHPQQLFANLSGATVAISKDGGLTWNRQNYADESYFGYSCILHILDNKPDEIYQGAEAPLDHAWLGKYNIDATDAVELGDLQKIIGDNYEWDNRRPNSMESFSSNPGVLYVGMEGALSKVEGAGHTYVYKADMNTNNYPYTYVKGIWLDPSDKQHIIFGGGVNGVNTTLSLYETFDEGETIVQISDKLGMQDPEIIDIVATDPFPAILIRDNADGGRLRLVVYR